MIKAITLLFFLITTGFTFANLPYRLTKNDVEFDAATGTITNYNNSKQKVIIIPDNLEGDTVKIICNNAFRNKGLTSVAIPHSVTTIRKAAFAFNQLSSVVIPNTATKVDNTAFAYNGINTVTIISPKE
ncbi:MAG: leucine-rich repeat domain-containing protein [Bacteroidales bacterium]|nr:leucine-rich repeat domain-containing protein [Bacteroidales bacterium]